MGTTGLADEFNQINNGENDDPDDIDKVPVETGHFCINRTLVCVDLSVLGVEEHAEKPNYADCHVHTMGAG